ncbi:hypothetical protein ACM43_11155 [Bradyrhizobium sp. CCBAU 45321]|nr:hypothetical protein [Bradyrhizobium sp. CCBAU 45321]
MQNLVNFDVHITQIVEWAEEISNEFSVVGDVFEATNGFKFPRQVIRNLSNRGVCIEGAIPGTPIVVIETISAGACVRKRSVDERKASSTKYQLAWIELRKPGLLRHQPSI